jgi:hypothetical protein
LKESEIEEMVKKLEPKTEEKTIVNICNTLQKLAQNSFHLKYLLFFYLLSFFFLFFLLLDEESCKIILKQGILTRLSNVISRHASDKAKVSFHTSLFHFLSLFLTLIKKTGMMLLFCLSLFSKKLETEFSTDISIRILSEIVEVFFLFILYFLYLYL